MGFALKKKNICSDEDPIQDFADTRSEGEKTEEVFGQPLLAKQNITTVAQKRVVYNLFFFVRPEENCCHEY